MGQETSNLYTPINSIELLSTANPTPSFLERVRAEYALSTQLRNDAAEVCIRQCQLSFDRGDAPYNVPYYVEMLKRVIMELTVKGNKSGCYYFTFMDNKHNTDNRICELEIRLIDRILESFCQETNFSQVEKGDDVLHSGEITGTHVKREFNHLLFEWCIIS